MNTIRYYLQIPEGLDDNFSNKINKAFMKLLFDVDRKVIGDDSREDTIIFVGELGGILYKEVNKALLEKYGYKVSYAESKQKSCVTIMKNYKARKIEDLMNLVNDMDNIAIEITSEAKPCLNVHINLEKELKKEKVMGKIFG